MVLRRASDDGIVDDDGLDAQRAQWLEQLASAAQLAIGRLRELDDPGHKTLLEDLESFHDRLVAQLGR
jgi:hypothetical protein